jgi:hypothetical protein
MVDTVCDAPHWEQYFAVPTRSAPQAPHLVIVAGAAGFSVATHVNVDAVRKEGA